VFFVSNIPVKDSLQKNRKKIRKKLPITKLGKKELFEKNSGYTNFDKAEGMWTSPVAQLIDDIFPTRRPTWQMGLSVLRGRIDEEEGKTLTPIIKSGAEEGTCFMTMIIVQYRTLTLAVKRNFFDYSKD